MRDLATLMRLSPVGAYAAASRLRSRGLALPVERGKYLLLGFEPERVLSNPLFVATQLVQPSYVGYRSALHYHGLLEQAPREVVACTTRRKARVDAAGFHIRYVVVRPRKFFGYRRERSGELEFPVAEPEKAVVDGLDQPRHAGGVGEVARALAGGVGSLDMGLLAEHAAAMGSRSLCSRLGHLLERLGAEAPALLPLASKGFVRLDPGRPWAAGWDRRWRVNVNLEDKDWLGPGVE